jgi:hypothetical protein
VNRPACRHEDLFDVDDPTNDGPTVHLAAPALRSLAVASIVADADEPSKLPYLPTSGTQEVAHAPEVFSATTRRSPAVYIIDADAQTKRIVAAIWALAGVLFMWLGYLVFESITHS